MSYGPGDRVVSLLAPEGTEIRFALATIGERIAAYTLDFLLSTVLVVAFVLFGAFLSAVTFSEHVFALVFMLVFFLRYGYFLFFEAHWQGGTPGKRVVGLRVVSRDGGQLPLGSIVARNVMRDLEIGLPFSLMALPQQIAGVGPWWLVLPALGWLVVVVALPFVTKERTRAGDLVAGTVVVRIPKSDLRRDEARAAQKSVIQFTREQLGHYGEHELETLASLLRAMETGRATQEDLLLVAATIAKRIGWTGSEPQRRPEEFLRIFYRDQRAELERALVLGRRIADKHERAAAKK